MARQVKYGVKPFNLEDAPIVEENERILEQGKQKAQVEQSMQAEAPSPATATVKNVEKKTQNGITIYVPMDYYMQIIKMKMQTGTPIKDIARQAVMEYLDRHRDD